MDISNSQIVGQVAASNANYRPQKSRNVLKGKRKGKPGQYYEDPSGAIRRAYRRFSASPTPQPMSVCFHCPHLSLTHSQVLHFIRHRLSILEEPDRFTIQYLPRNVIHGASGLEDRWVITLETPTARTELQRGLFLKGQSFVVRRYDDVVGEEYQKFLRLSSMTSEVLALGLQ